MENVSVQEKVENKIIDLINESTGGRLIIFKPENSEISLIVEKRGDYKKNPLSVKIYGFDVLEKSQDVIKNIGKGIAPQKDVFLLVAYFDIVKQDIEDSVWMAPSSSVWDGSAGDFSKFLMGKKEIGRFLLGKIGK